MTLSINAAAGGGTIGALKAAAPGGSAVENPLGANSLGKDTFLKLLVAQLRFQDPSKPTDASQFLSQTAQFTLVEKFDALAEANTAVLNATQTQAATAMVGRQISWSDSTGNHSGTVTAVSIKNGTPALRIGELEVPFTAVTEVKPAS